MIKTDPTTLPTFQQARPAYEPMGALRLLFALFVVIGHLFLLGPETDEIRDLNLNKTGVALFFIISGYIIFSAYDNFYRGKTLNFAVNRFLRIYPLYWIVYIASFFPTFWIGVPEIQNYSVGEFVSDLTLLGKFLEFSKLPTMGQAWSIIVELKFYLAAFVFFAVSERLKFNGIRYHLLFLIAVGAYLLVWLTDSYTRFFAALQWAPVFSLGIAVHLYKRSKYSSKGYLLWILVMFFISIHQYYMYNVYNSDYTYFFQPSLQIFIFFILVFIWIVSPFRRALPQKIDSFFGKLSYPVFLIHYPVIYILRFTEPFSSINLMIVAITLTFTLSILNIYLIDPSVNRLRNKIRGSRI